MKLDIEKTYVLELNEKEALWLKGVMQNPLHGQFPDEESTQDQEMRRRFWDYLKDVDLI